ncbi:bone morphogenetic protein receptor type-2-like [Girardinichthys multiradiatus]|uniref:bone morphogenetic protein receptor type-2-like n=1 Tax=Girardinichthys multiradiatus TaxID=208333 RepID=UPI001FABD839|nr:bone morphogenetic protein receptor type-2-like [Girardinichthys multiradiatus]XP_047227043.1 bone morphogenetic protein receptor type-2-like [Girardinichthys multiradiatus]XP_047227044.1 bone morphogenetic protein receptor type-2-like [Girardinichthys multiradiatus]
MRAEFLQRSNMAASALTVCVFVLLLAGIRGLQLEDREERICAFASSLKGAEPASTNELRGDVQENGTIRCSRGSRCYGLWERQADGEMELLSQGCWRYVGNFQECYGDRCILMTTPAQMQKASYRFCCCSHDLCNTNYTEAPPTPDTPALRSMRRDNINVSHTDRQLTVKETALVALVTVAIAALLIMALFLGYRVIKRKHKYGLSAMNVMEAANSESAVDLDNLKLLELIGRGRYGAVFRGSLNERCVAVKVFSSANYLNFSNECSIYQLPLLQQHDNIVRFLTADEKTSADGRPEFLILMEFYPHGCLSQYLSGNTVDWLTCCRMAHGVTRGLAFLHTELYRGEQYKPPVAHRDLTSRNVLVRSDLSCVLADFGLSMKLTGTRTSRPGDEETMAISEVGTVRYMSPEVLGGALNLRDCESALKQVDVYALGLLYWESFRRCSDLFPGEAVPDYQLAFQAEVGNHPSFEDMQILVVREKHRPRFPEVWKENSLALRALKETMEDCWDQDAEARLTAQCAEERLADLILLSPHTALHNHRNLWTPQVGSASSYIEDLQVDVVKNLQGDGQSASLVRTTMSGAEGGEKNRNCINQQRQQIKARLVTSDCRVMTSSGLRADSVLRSVSDPSGGAAPSVPICLQLTEEDLEASKLDPKQVQKNLRKTSQENLMEHSEKFGSVPQTSNLHHSMEVTSQEEPGPPSSIQPLPKQQNLPQRPTSLHLLPKPSESRLKLGRLRSTHRQVETGVAKMNTVIPSAEPHLVTTVTNMRTANGNEALCASSSHSSGVPILVTNKTRGIGKTNPAGPQEEEVDEVRRRGGDGDSQLNLNLNFSPDEHEPLLRREQLPAESDPPPPRLHHGPPSRAGGRGSNSNNNNNRLALGSEVHLPAEVSVPEPESRNREPPAAVSVMEPKILISGLETLLVHPAGRGEGSDTETCQKEVKTLTGGFLGGLKEQNSASSATLSKVHQNPTMAEIVATGVPLLDISTLEAKALDSASAEGPTSEPAGLQNRSSEPQTAGVLQSQLRQTKTRRPQRPCSLDLSSSCISSDEVSVMDPGSLSATGEKIKRRVKTPYTLKKWRPASWVVSTDKDLDLEFEFSSGQVQESSGLHRAGGGGAPRINQSKSSMAVFLVGGGSTATTTSEPDGMTRF